MHENNSFAISIAGWVVSLEFANLPPRTFDGIRDWYRDFIVPCPAGGKKMHIRLAQGDPFLPPGPYSTWPIETRKHNGRVEFRSLFEAGRIDLRDYSGELVMRPQGKPENFLRVLYSWICTREDSLLLHACGVVRNARGYVFFGHSGSGKTTIAGLAEKGSVLSDDLVILTKRDGGFFLHGVPFRGDMPDAPHVNTSVPLQRVFALAKDTGHHVERLSTAEAIGRLSSCVPFVMEEPNGALKVIDICTRLATRHPVSLLHFARDPGFWKVIDELG